MIPGLLNPIGAVSLVAVGVLVVLWLWERRRRVVPVGTLFLWQRVPSSPLERRRLRPDLLFLLQLLVLLTLCGAAVRPYLERPAPPSPGRTAIVLDLSASMQAREARGATRFALARRRARTLLDGLGAGAEVMIVTAAARPRVVVGWTDDLARARATLDGLAPLDTPTDLAPGLGLALAEARARPGTRIVALTDLPPEDSGLAPEARAAIDWLLVGRTDDNVAIAGLRVEAAPFRGLADTTATIVVRNYGHAARTVTVEARVDGEPWARHALTVAPRASESIVLRDPPRAGRLDVLLGADDALGVDDRAFAWIEPQAPLDLLLVTESPELGDAFGALARAAGGRVEVVNRARWDEEPVGGRQVALFDGFVPSAPPPMNALYAAPPPGNAVCPGDRVVGGVAVVDWEADHPAVAGLEDLQAIAVARALRLTSPGWGTPVVLAAVRGVPFPLLVAGERDGRRVACLGAELSPSLTSSDQVPLLLLVLGTLRWLAAGSAPPALVVDTGVATPAGFNPAEAPAGLRFGGEPPVVLAERAGAFRAGAHTVLANLFDDRESDIGRADPRDRPATSRAIVSPPQGKRREIGWWLLLAAALLLGVEWLVWLAREPV